jgi:hypothetical protein
VVCTRLGWSQGRSQPPQVGGAKLKKKSFGGAKIRKNNKNLGKILFYFFFFLGEPLGLGGPSPKVAPPLVGAVREAHDPIFPAGLWVFSDRLKSLLHKGTPGKTRAGAGVMFSVCAGSKLCFCLCF